jgi:hypothetical protein
VVLDDVTRDLDPIELRRWGRVAPVTGVVPWLVLDPDGAVVEPVRRFLLEMVARDSSPSSVRSYA